MAEPFPNVPGWLVWVIIAFTILIGCMCMATFITGIYTGKWWLLILGLVSTAVWYFEVLLKIFPDIRKLFK